MKFFPIFLFAFPLFAAPVGDPAFPRLIEMGFFTPCKSIAAPRAGYEGDFVADARMAQFIDSSGRVDTYSQETNSGTLTANLINRIDVYTVLGTSRTYADWRFTESGDTHRAQVETLYNFLWGAGTRGIIYETDKISIGLGARYEEAHYDNLWLTIDGLIQKVNGTFLHWREWQVDIDLGYQIDIFTPYLGVKYSNARSIVGNFSVPIAGNGGGINQFKNRTPVGVFIGCSLSSGRDFMLNVEGRLVDEEAVTISGDLKF